MLKGRAVCGGKGQKANGQTSLCDEALEPPAIAKVATEVEEGRANDMNVGSTLQQVSVP